MTKASLRGYLKRLRSLSRASTHPSRKHASFTFVYNSTLLNWNGRHQQREAQ